MWCYAWCIPSSYKRRDGFVASTKGLIAAIRWRSLASILYMYNICIDQTRSFLCIAMHAFKACMHVCNTIYMYILIRIRLHMHAQKAFLLYCVRKPPPQRRLTPHTNVLDCLERMESITNLPVYVRLFMSLCVRLFLVYT